MPNEKKKVLLIILDGVGAAPASQGNAVVLSNPKNLMRMWSTFPHTYLITSGEAVGLPDKTKGNSEVGHLNIGAGRVVTQTLPRINKSIQSGAYKKNTVLWDTLMHAIKHQSNIHLMGCFSDGSVHAHINHFIATLEFFAENNFKGKVFFHLFTDGRDTPPDSGKKYLHALQETIDMLGIGQIATLCGRAFAMDRGERWERTQKAYDLIFKGIGTRYSSWDEAINKAYEKNVSDEYIEPCIINHNDDDHTVKDNDAIIFLNYRADRAIQLSMSIEDVEFNKFQRIPHKNIFFASMIEYKKAFPKHVLFPKEYINSPLGKVISTYGMRQLRISETEKFPHVTYFFNGGMPIQYPGEDRIQVPSPSVATYDLKPEMSLLEILEILRYRIETDMYDFLVLNIANGDMVGHTGNLAASIKSMQIVDFVTNELVRLFTARNGVVIITADHGNVEEVINLKTGDLDTEHSTNPVPTIIIDPSQNSRSLPYGSLKDIAPTVLKYMGIPLPTEMTGKSLI